VLTYGWPRKFAPHAQLVRDHKTLGCGKTLDSADRHSDVGWMSVHGTACDIEFVQDGRGDR
jgi:hypothetical protein